MSACGTPGCPGTLSLVSLFDGIAGFPLAATSQAAVAFNETADGNSAHEGFSPSVKTGTGGGATSVSVPAMAVRRLTPTECERLQGYPDGWTATSYGRAQADAPRYRQLGNSIAVPVFEWVAGRLVAVDRGDER